MSFHPLRPDDPATVGPYRLVGQLGAGGMGIVFLARTRGGTPVALKLIRPEYASDPTFRARFAREVEVGQRVSGLCIARYLDADAEAERPYLVTEYVEGPGLGEVVAARGPFSGDQLQALAAGLAEGLVSLHRAGIVHRDLKPSNVLLARDAPKIIDFGIAHAGDATSMTRTGHVVGSAGWMSPEQASGEAVTTAADVFAWASVMTFAATGRPPFGEGAPAAIIYRVVHQDPDLAGVPAALAEVLRDAFAKDPAGRPDPTTLLARVTTGADGDLANVLQVAWLPVAPLEPEAAADARAALEQPDGATDQPVSLSNRTRWLVAAAVLALVIGGVIGWALLRDGGADEQGTPSTVAPTLTTLEPSTTTASTTSTSTTSTTTTTQPTTTTEPTPEAAWSTVRTELPEGTEVLELFDSPDGPIAVTALDDELVLWTWNGQEWSERNKVKLPAPVLGSLALRAERLTGARTDDVFVTLEDGLASVVTLENGRADLARFDDVEGKRVDAVEEAVLSQGRVTGRLDGEGPFTWRYDPAASRFTIEDGPTGAGG